MRKSTRCMTVIGMAIVAVALSGASFAWACSQQAKASVEGGRSSGPPGTQVVINGTDFGSGPVEIRWDSASGEQLGQAMGPKFSVTVAIPEAAVGVHYIVAAQILANGNGSVAFEVTEAPKSTAPASDPTAQTNGRTASNASGAEEGSAAGASTRQGSNGNGTLDDSPTMEPTIASGQASANTAGANAADGSVANANAADGKAATSLVGQPAKARVASANPAALTTPSGAVIFGGSEATAEVTQPGVLTGAAGTVSGDTWSGVGSATKPSLLLDGDLLAQPDPATGEGAPPAAGLALLGSAVVAMSGGFAVAERRRKRALARAESR